MQRHKYMCHLIEVRLLQLRTVAKTRPTSRRDTGIRSRLLLLVGSIIVSGCGRYRYDDIYIKHYGA